MAKTNKDLYANVRDRIESYFKKNGFEVKVGLKDNCYADFGSLDGSIIGEIKSNNELMSSGKTAWGFWRKPKKRHQLRSVESLSAEVVGSLNPEEKEIVATVIGQLQTYVRNASLKSGWVVFEDNEKHWMVVVQSAIKKMKENNLIQDGNVTEYEGLIFVHVKFCQTT